MLHYLTMAVRALLVLVVILVLLRLIGIEPYEIGAFVRETFGMVGTFFDGVSGD